MCRHGNAFFVLALNTGICKVLLRICNIAKVEMTTSSFEMNICFEFVKLLFVSLRSGINDGKNFYEFVLCWGVTHSFILFFVLGCHTFIHSYIFSPTNALCIFVKRVFYAIFLKRMGHIFKERRSCLSVYIFSCINYLCIPYGS